MRKFRELDIWKRSIAFCTEVYKATAVFPTDEKYGLIIQIRRASISIPSNIAEGCSRKSNADFKRFLEISIGSAYELETQLIIATELKYINPEESRTLIESIQEIIKMTAKYKSSVESSL